MIPSPNVHLNQTPLVDNDQYLADFSENYLKKYGQSIKSSNFDFNEYICNKYTIGELRKVNIFSVLKFLFFIFRRSQPFNILNKFFMIIN